MLTVTKSSKICTKYVCMSLIINNIEKYPEHKQKNYNCALTHLYDRGVNVQIITQYYSLWIPSMGSNFQSYRGLTSQVHFSQNFQCP